MAYSLCERVHSLLGKRYSEVVVIANAFKLTVIEETAIRRGWHVYGEAVLP